LNRLVGSIVEIRQNKLIRYRGNYDDYLVQREGKRSATPRCLQKPAARNRPTDGIRKPLSRKKHKKRRRHRGQASSRLTGWKSLKRPVDDRPQGQLFVPNRSAAV